MKPYILIAAPVRNRAWILPKYLDSLENLDYPKDKLAFCFIINDSTDDSKDILENWKGWNEKDYRYIRIAVINFGCPRDWGEDGTRVLSKKLGISRRDLYTYPALAALRNIILASARLDKKIEYLFSVDSDILLSPDILNKLLEGKKDIAAALIENGTNKKTNFKDYNFIPIDGFGKRYILPDGPAEVKITGAAVLISRRVFSKEKIIYYSAKSGEDEGFCESARVFGFKSYIFPELQKHIMKKEMMINV